MAFLEWRRFTFFDTHANVDNGKIAECLQDTKVSVVTSGNGQVIVCDTTGWVHLISRVWEITSFKAYELNVSHAQQLPHDSLLVTIGDEEAAISPMIKVWDWARRDRHGSPACVRVSRAVPSHLRPTPATALAVHPNKNLMAVGFQDGSVTLFRGDIARQRSKMKTLNDTGTSPITRIEFCGADKMFIVSRAAVLVHHVAAERLLALDARGAAPACAALSGSTLTVAHSDVIYGYTADGRGPCYVFPGEKLGVTWFRSYLVITTTEPKPNTANTEPTKTHHLTILDIQNKFIAFAKAFDEIDAVIAEWGSLYVLTKNKEVIHLEEKDQQSKLSLLFKKNRYDMAIRIMMYSKQQHDTEGLMEVYKQYGDHLYSKGDLKGAVDQYVKTIGWLENSYVIRKYLESRHLEPLVQYLEELHKKGFATEDHTTLLLTCYVKIDQHDQQGKLKEFINSKDKTIHYDVDVAIKVVRQVSVEDALSLAAINKRHDAYLKITLDDKKDYKQALNYMVELQFEDAEMYMRKYGHLLIEYAPEESTQFLKTLCTNYRPRSQPLVDESSLQGGIVEPERSLPDDYIHMFLSNSEKLIDFLEHMVASDVQCSKLVYNALIEHYIHVWAKSTGPHKDRIEQKIMKVLKDPEANYDKDHTLIICQMLGFKSGILHLYEESKLWRAQLSLHIRAGDSAGAMSVCRARGSACPQLWTDVLRSSPPAECLPEILTVVGNEKLLSHILVIDTLASTPSYTLGDVRKYITSVLTSELAATQQARGLAHKFRREIGAGAAAAAALQRAPVTFQGSRCAACNRPLELPSVHFLCQHSFHHHCFQSFSESERSCPACGRPPAAPARAPPPADALHARLHATDDPYAVVSEYFGRGLFNKVTVLTEPATPDVGPTPIVPTNVGPITPASAPMNYGPGAEAKLRLQEGQSKQVFVPSTNNQMPAKGSAVIPVPEGRMRLMELQQYSSSLEANLTNLEPVHKRPSLLPTKQLELASSGSPKISSSIANEGKNPFEDTYDEDKNPFADDAEPKNPFDEDDYDKNLNPFS